VKNVDKSVKEVIATFKEGRFMYAIAAQVTKKNGDDAVKFNTASINECLSLYGYPALDTKFTWLSTRQLRAEFKEMMYEEDAQAWTEWLTEDVTTQVLKIAKTVKPGTRLRILNSLVVREHPDYPELYSLTDAWRAARSYYLNEKGNLTKAAEKKWMLLRPRQWLQPSSKWLKELCGKITSEVSNENFHFKQGNKSDAFKHCVQALRAGGRNSATGTYVHPQILIKYTEELHPTLHQKVLKVFQDYSEGRLVDPDRARGTKERARGKEIHADLVEVCSERRMNTMGVVNKIWKGWKGMDKKAYKAKTGKREPIRDNISRLEHIELSMAECIAAHGIVENDAYGQAAGDIEGLKAGQFVRKNFSSKSKKVKA
jgi:hypothetical protein